MTPFTYNLVQWLGSIGAGLDLVVHRNDLLAPEPWPAAGHALRRV